MTWIPLTYRLAALPLILAGPIVRRVEPCSVTIWLALKEARRVTLHIYKRDSADQLTECFTGSQQTISIGHHLHVAAVTATTSDDEQALAWGEMYYYDLVFQKGSELSSEENLATPGVLVQHPELAEPLDRLLYPGHPLPSFVLPAQDMQHLRIMHGSCRKPHGIGQEMLSTVDTLILEAEHEGKKRPQQLYLTGDQIYADDVATPLLLLLLDADTVLCADRQEKLPLLTQYSHQLMPIRRREILRNWAMLTSSHSHNHLVTYSEYALMYLFSWSDTLWPAQFPAIEELWQTHKELLPPPEERARIKVAYEEDCAQLESFRTTLPLVRRALANTATYMIFDDHDVTDDWYLDGAWCQQVITNPLGRRILRNGMLAMALCQAWGNTPDQFARGNGADLLTTVDGWDGISQTQKVEEILGLPAAFKGKGELSHPHQTLDWHFSFRGPTYQALFLDTRTQRYYRDDDDFPGLLSFRAIEQQLTSQAQQDVDVSLIISPAPVLGVDFIEMVQFWSRWRIKENYTYDREAWALDLETFQAFLKAVSSMKRVVFLSGDVHYGYGASMDHWDRHTGRTARLVNFTASALSNEGAGSQMAILAMGYPRLLKLLRGPLPMMDFFVWDIVGKSNPVVNYILTRIWKRFYRIWWAIPRLIAAHRSPSRVVLPAEGWLQGSFDAFPPDRSYRLFYHYNDLSESPVPREQARSLSRVWFWLMRLMLSFVGTLQTSISNVRSSLLRRADATNLQPRLLTQPGQRFTREALETTEVLEHKLEKRRANLLKQLLSYEDWMNRWKAGNLIIGYNNIGEIFFQDVERDYEVVQRLWWRHPTTPAKLNRVEYHATLQLPVAENEPPLP